MKERRAAVVGGVLLLHICILSTLGVSIRPHKGGSIIPHTTPKKLYEPNVPVYDSPGLRVLLGMDGIKVAEAPIQAMVEKSFIDTSLPDVVRTIQYIPSILLLLIKHSFVQYGSAGTGIPHVDVDYHLYNIKVHGFAFKGSTSITLDPKKDQIVASM